MECFQLILYVLRVLLLCIRIRLQKFDKSADINNFLFLCTHLPLNLLKCLSKPLYLEAVSRNSLQLHLEETHVSVLISGLLQVLLCIPDSIVVTVG
jgi:hypothetical protein